MSPLLQIKNVSAFYGKRHILHNIFLDVRTRDKLLIIGPNGSGKTTLLKSINGLVIPQSGEITYLGKEFTHVSTQKRVKSGIGTLLQTGNIVRGLTVKENFELAGFSLKKNLLADRIALILDSLPFLKSRLKARAGLLSGGERQALAIGMVIIKKPRILLLDEPTAGLSPKAATEIIDILKMLQKNFSVEAICMVEHNLKLALAWASRIVILVQGKIVFESQDPQRFIGDASNILEKYYFEQAITVSPNSFTQ